MSMYKHLGMCLYSPIQNSSRFIQLLGVLLCVVHVISQAAVTQTIGEATDFIIQLVMKRTQFVSDPLQVLQTENNKALLT